jgi:hypothetical protein
MHFEQRFSPLFENIVDVKTVLVLKGNLLKKNGRSGQRENYQFLEKGEFDQVIWFPRVQHLAKGYYARKNHIHTHTLSLSPCGFRPAIVSCQILVSVRCLVFVAVGICII